MAIFRKFFKFISYAIILSFPNYAFADWKIVDALDVSPLVPKVLDAFMIVATGGYEYFVGSHGGGILYLLIFGVLAITIAAYVIKMFFPKNWLAFFGFTPSDEIGKADGITMVQNVLKPAVRAIIAIVVLLQIKPIFLTQWLINPFLQFGSLYTDALVKEIPSMDFNPPHVECPPDIIEKGWVSKSSCEFLVQPIATLSYANNQIVKRGLQYVTLGLSEAISIVNVGKGILDILTGLILVVTFVSCNIFMALLIIQAIFNFGMAIILYPFQVLVWVAKKNDKWVDIWPAFSGIIKALQEIIVTMIACAFILCVNVAIVHSLFNWDKSVFSESMTFGDHSMLWISSVLTFFVMLRIFAITREKLEQYVGSDMTKLYTNVKSDIGTAWKKINSLPNKIKEIKKIKK